MNTNVLYLAGSSMVI